MSLKPNPNDRLNTLHLSHEQLCDHLLSLAPVAAPDGTSASDTSVAASNQPVPQTGPYLVSAEPNETPALLAGLDAETAVEDHLRAGPLCASELNSLQAVLFDFRAAATNYAAAELRGLASHPSPSQTTQRIFLLAAKPDKPAAIRPLTWAIAAMLLVGATIGSMVPLRLHHLAQPPAAAGAQAAPTGESDEALLEEVDQTLSTEVPSAMKPLSDPLSNQQSLASTTDQTTGKTITHE